MRDRCNNPNHAEYGAYGGRGISVCKEWENDVVAFYKWATANGYSDGLTIDRIDNDKGYSPSNCRWVTRKEQANNRRSNHTIVFGGVSNNIRQWAKITGIKEATIRMRIERGWSPERALTTTHGRALANVQKVLDEAAGEE